MAFPGDGPPPEQPSLARQLSVYSLTFDEFQSTLGGPGKDFGSMNMDELLKSIWTAEESQAMALAAGGGLDSGIQRQGSLTLPRTLSQRTVDEVWRDMVLESGPASSAATELPHQRQPTLGEMTLEEFLVRAGVVMEFPAPSVVPGPTASSNTGLALGFPPACLSGGTMVADSIPSNSVANLPITAAGAWPNGAPLVGDGFVGVRDPGFNNGTMRGLVGLPTGGVTVTTVGPLANPMPSEGLGTVNGGGMSSVSPVPYVFAAGPRARKGAIEKVVERRQRRMIKNRESAARSRARKQAYIMELEVEVAKLKEQNQELQRKQAQMLEKRKNQLLEAINQQHHRPKKPCLRRTTTGPW